MKKIFTLLKKTKASDELGSTEKIEPDFNEVKTSMPDSDNAEILYPNGSRYFGGIANGKRSGYGVMVYLTDSISNDRLSISESDQLTWEEIQTVVQYNIKWNLIKSTATDENSILEATNAIETNHKLVVEKIKSLCTKHCIVSKRGASFKDSQSHDTLLNEMLSHNEVNREILIEINDHEIESLGICYDGSWQDDLFHGKGTYTWTDGVKYEGNFHAGRIEGKGLLVCSDGDSYLGFFKNGFKHGRGTTKYNNGDLHVGYWWLGSMSGKGTYTWSSGQKYHGKYKNFMKNGGGTLTFSDGSCYQGLWRAGKIYGNGVFISADGQRHEGKWSDNKLYELLDTLRESSSTNSPVNGEAPSAQESISSVTEYINSQFDKLVGLNDVKNEIRQQANLLEIQKMRLDSGLKNLSSPSRHLVFSGNPGTGKTVFARIVAGMYMRLGILKTDKVVEVDRGGLVAGFIGHTAIKTKEVFDSALGGVLFIDEAYALVKEGGVFSDFGQEAIDTLLKLMEDNREKIVVIVAGYKGKMDSFIASNPGLASRFNTKIDFPNYTADELWQILEMFAKENSYAIDKNVKEFILPHFAKDAERYGESFGNARYVRNLFEKTLQLQATRLMSNLAKPSKADLIQLTLEDFQSATQY